MRLSPIRVALPPDDRERTALGRAWARVYEDAHELLKLRIREHGIPYDASMPQQDVVVVWRFPSKADTTMSAGGLHIPQTAQQAAEPFSVGILLFAGLDALDKLAGNGILPGDRVRFAKYAGDEEAVSRVKEAIADAISTGKSEADAEVAALALRDAELAKDKLLQMRISDVHSSIDLLERLYGAKPTMEIVREEHPKGLLHVIRPLMPKRPKKGK